MSQERMMHFSFYLFFLFNYLICIYIYRTPISHSGLLSLSVYVSLSLYIYISIFLSIYLFSPYLYLLLSMSIYIYIFLFIYITTSDYLFTYIINKSDYLNNYITIPITTYAFVIQGHG